LNAELGFNFDIYFFVSDIYGAGIAIKKNSRRKDGEGGLV